MMVWQLSFTLDEIREWLARNTIGDAVAIPAGAFIKDAYVMDDKETVMVDIDEPCEEDEP